MWDPPVIRLAGERPPFPSVILATLGLQRMRSLLRLLRLCIIVRAIRSYYVIAIDSPHGWIVSFLPVHPY